MRKGFIKKMNGRRTTSPATLRAISRDKYFFSNLIVFVAAQFVATHVTNKSKTYITNKSQTFV